MLGLLEHSCIQHRQHSFRRAMESLGTDLYLRRLTHMPHKHECVSSPLCCWQRASMEHISIRLPLRRPSTAGKLSRVDSVLYDVRERILDEVSRCKTGASALRRPTEQ